MISAGDLDGRRELAEENIRELAELARKGCRSSAPSRRRLSA